MAKKRKAEEQISGVPVNKRKSLLMKPRHYSPSVECKEETEDRTELQEDINVLETSAPTGSDEERLHFVNSVPSKKLRGAVKENISKKAM